MTQRQTSIADFHGFTAFTCLFSIFGLGLSCDNPVSMSFLQGYTNVIHFDLARRFPCVVFLECLPRFCGRPEFCDEVFDCLIFQPKPSVFALYHLYRQSYVFMYVIVLLLPPRLIAGGGSGNTAACHTEAHDCSFYGLLRRYIFAPPPARYRGS